MKRKRNEGKISIKCPGNDGQKETVIVVVRKRHFLHKRCDDRASLWKRINKEGKKKLSFP